MATCFDLTSIYDSCYFYYEMPRVWLLDYAPSIIPKISTLSFFDLENVYLRCDPDGNLFEDTLTKDPHVEVMSGHCVYVEKFTEHCLGHKIPFTFDGFMAYDWSCQVDYIFRWHLWFIRPDGIPKSLDVFRFKFDDY